MAENNWIEVAQLADIAEGTVAAYTIGEQEIAIYHLEGGEIRASDNICTHEYARLCEGWLEDGVIECPLHAGQFDVRTGKGLCEPIERDLPLFETKVADGTILIKFPAWRIEASERNP